MSELIKISDLNNLPKASLDPANDYIPIVDYSENETKSIKVADIQESSTGLPTTGDNLDFLVYANKKILITGAAKVSTYVLDITLNEPHGLITGNTVKIYYEDRIQGFPQSIYGTFTITNIISNVVRIGVGFDLGAGSFTTAGYLEAVGNKTYDYFYSGAKSVELRYGDGKSKFFSKIQSAIEEAVSTGGNVIVHKRATAYDENIILKNGVNITLEEGAVVTSSTASAVFSDDGVAVVCSILGSGVIKLLSTASSVNCIYIGNTNSELTLECDYIELTGPPTTYSAGACIKFYGKKINVKANKILAKSGVGIWLVLPTVEKFNLEIGEIETGIVGQPLTGTTALLTHGEGFIKINKITNNNGGHTFSHRKGKCVAYINGQYKLSNTDVVSAIACLGSQSYNDVELTLFFDEIVSLGPTCIESGRGVMNLYGRKIWCAANSAITFGYSASGPESLPGYPTGIIEVDDIYSNVWYAIDINSGNNSTPVLIKNSKIHAYGVSGMPTGMGALNIGGTGVPINSSAIVRNCHIRQYTSNASTHAIRLGDGTQTVTLSGCELESAHSSSYSIYSAGNIDRNVAIRLPIWQNKSEHSYIHYITTGGTIIQ